MITCCMIDPAGMCADMCAGMYAGILKCSACYAPLCSLEDGGALLFQGVGGGGGGEEKVQG